MPRPLNATEVDWLAALVDLGGEVTRSNVGWGYGFDHRNLVAHGLVRTESVDASHRRIIATDLAQPRLDEAVEDRLRVFQAAVVTLAQTPVGERYEASQAAVKALRCYSNLLARVED